jgi:deoxyhypusine monooxygenase
MAALPTQSAQKGQPELLSQLRAALNDSSVPLSQRYRALFALKHHACLNPPTTNTIPAIEAIASAFGTPSALLKHEVAYCLGQTRNTATVPHLRAVLENASEDPMVRHEAAEALGALGDNSSVALLKQKRDDPAEATVVRETCDIAVERIRWEMSDNRKAERLKKRYTSHSNHVQFQAH